MYSAIVQILGVDAGGVGRTILLQNWTFDVVSQPPFVQIKPLEVKIEANTIFDEETAQIMKSLLVDNIYRYTIKGNITDYISGYLGLATYRIDISNCTGDIVKVRDEIIINTKSGTFQATPTEAYTAIVQIVAVDAGGVNREVVLQTWAFESVPKQQLLLSDTPFALELAASTDPTISQTAGANQNLPSQLIAYSTYRYVVGGDISHYVTNNLGSLSYRLSIESENIDAKNDILINTDTGTLQASPTSLYSAIVQILGVDAGGVGRTILLQNWTFDVVSQPPFVQIKPLEVKIEANTIFDEETAQIMKSLLVDNIYRYTIKGNIDRKSVV